MWLPEISLKSEELKKKLKLKDGGEKYVIAFSGLNQKYIVLASRVNEAQTDINHVKEDGHNAIHFYNLSSILNILPPKHEPWFK